VLVTQSAKREVAPRCARLGRSMPFATNGQDGARVYFEDQGGDGAAVVLHDGFADSVEDLREWALADALASEGFRVIFVDHRGHGRSDKPHDPAAYAPGRVADAVAVLDGRGIERAHFVGRSWGGRLCFGIGEHAPGRVRSLVIGGNQPYAWPDSPISRAVGQALAAAREQLSSEPLVRAFEAFWDIEFPSPQRERLLDNDPLALHAAWNAAMAEGPISADLGRWRVPCPIFIGAADAHFLEGARRAADEIPDAELLVLEEADHYAAHMSRDEILTDAALRTLRRGG
jgi:pimeloyl-ACP methyl ester carboxylesterase